VWPEARAASEERRELSGPREHGRQSSRRIEGRVDGRGGREEGGDGHHREAGVSERGPRGFGDRRLAVADRLLDCERAEDAERDEDVQGGGDPQRGIHRPGELTGGVAQVAHGERDDTEAQVGEEGESNTRDDVRDGWIAAEGEQVEVDVDQRHGDEDREDGEQDDDDQRLRAIHNTRADQVDRGHGNHHR
jgi:hypothetical protein